MSEQRWAAVDSYFGDLMLTLGGYRTIWLGRALQPGGRLVTMEAEPRHVEVARGNIAAAGLADMVEIRTGAALDSLPKLPAKRPEPFNLVFIDADKQNNPAYLDRAIQLARPGSLIIVDKRGRQRRDPRGRPSRSPGTGVATFR